ncbi:hypothetical protein BT63DRAFT_428707 [Microthyrium microscopicum]|uniref:Uncharacterized protein n=1 Tax=Microthyrium microscopicum TaxID=703497 RepID=A0A6A6U2W4_9PEZI|nr:hypothetical protein BT63DRAFT_428707 [Microthyrium microscopicum]
MAPRLAYLGLGNIGRAMSKNLVEKGNLDSPLVLYNRTTSRAEALAETIGRDRAKVASTIAEAVKDADIIFTCVGTDEVDKETYATALEGDVKGKIFVDCATIHPSTSDELAKVVAEKGAEYIGCPVFGAPAMADAGQLVCVPAGPAGAVTKLKPYLKGVVGREIIDMSDREPSKAAALKLVGNSFVLLMVEMIAEGLTLAEKTGVGSDVAQNFLETMFGAASPMGAYAKRMTSGDYYKRDEPLLAIDLGLKDTNHILSLAKDSGTRMIGMETVKHHLEAVKEHAGSKGDMAGMYGAVRKESGLKYENE